MRRVEKVEFDSFEWDENKRLWVLAVREIDFVQVADALLRPHLTGASDRHGETRTLAICMIKTKLARAIYTARGSSCRIITAMAARRN